MFAHIPRPLGSISRTDENLSEAYIYEWAFGSEWFLWEYFLLPDDQVINLVPVEDLDELGERSRMAVSESL